MNRITRKDIDRELDFIRRHGVPIALSVWSPGDRLGTRYQLEFPEGHTRSRVLFGRSACYDTLNAIRQALDYQATPKWVNGTPIVDPLR